MKNVRYYIFWILDFLKGAHTRKHFNEVKEVFFNKPSSQGIQQKRLFDILDYAITSTSFYKDFNSKSLFSFPIITKHDILENMDAMFSSEFSYRKKSLKTMATSGSSGTPFKIYQNKDKVLRNHADLLFFYEVGGYDLGDRFYLMKVWDKFNQKSKGALFVKNMKTFNIGNLDIEGGQSFISAMKDDSRPKVLLTYASSFNSLMMHIEPGQVNWNIKTIFTNGEELLNETKQKMLKVFGCPVISRYSNQENGVLAQQPASGENYFQLNEASYYFEFLKLDSNEEAQEGEEARIVITDLFNKAIPVIRYDTGDMGKFAFTKNGKRVLTEVIGRKIDLLRSIDGKVLSPYMITSLIRENDNIAQFQFIQETLTSFKLKVVYADKSKQLLDKQKLTRNLKYTFGNDAEIDVIETDNIPSETSGKKKYVVSRVNIV